MRLLFVGHLGRAHDDEILFAKPVRVQRFSIVPHSTLAHNVIATTQQEPFELELSFQKKDAKELTSIHKGPVSRGGTCDIKERVVTSKLAFRGDYYRVCVAVYGELADLKEEARLEREALAAERPKTPSPSHPRNFTKRRRATARACSWTRSSIDYCEVSSRTLLRYLHRKMLMRVKTSGLLT